MGIEQKEWMIYMNCPYRAVDHDPRGGDPKTPFSRSTALQ